MAAAPPPLPTGAPSAEPLLGPRDVATRWGVPVSWVYSQAETGKLPAFKLGKYLRFRPAEVTAWLEAHRLQARNQEGR
jgi:excisionase family DNA binding protein